MSNLNTAQASPGLSLPEADERGWTSADKLGLAVISLLMAAGWWNTFYEMWNRWFPIWHNDKLTLTERLTGGDSYYSHGPLVPLASLVIAWMIHGRVGAPVKRTRGATALGWLGLIGFLMVHVASAYARVTFVSGFAFAGVLASLILLWGGWPLMRTYWLPVAFLVFMVPLPMETIAALNLRLKFMAGNAAVWLTNDLFGVPCNMYDSAIQFLPNPDGTPKTLIIEDVCSGLRSLISLICFASLFALLCRVRGVWRWVMLAMAVPVAILCNVVRITSLNLVANAYGVPAASPESWFHGFSGLMVFAVALGVLFMLERLILALGKWLHRDWSDSRLLGYLDRLQGAPRGRPGTLRPLPIVALSLAAAAAVFLSIQSHPQYRNNVASSAVPAFITLDGARYDGRDIALDQHVKDILETDDLIYRRYTSAAGKMVNLLIVFSQDNRKGTHPPEVCMQGVGQEVTGWSVADVPVPGLGTVQMRAIDSASNPLNRQEHLYVYKCGGSYTQNFYKQQLVILLNGLLRRDSGGALIHISVPVLGPSDDSRQDARRLALDGARTLLPILNSKLQ